MTRAAIEECGDESRLVAIEGEQLSDVTFVMDYLQLHFDGPALSLFIWPTIGVSDRKFKFGDAGYRDTLCGLITNVVVSASVKPGERLRLEFRDSNASLEVSLRPEAYQTVEGVVFQDSLTRECAIW